MKAKASYQQPQSTFLVISHHKITSNQISRDYSLYKIFLYQLKAKRNEELLDCFSYLFEIYQEFFKQSPTPSTSSTTPIKFWICWYIQNVESRHKTLIDESILFETDASSLALRVTFNQNGLPVAFLSRSLNKHERNHCWSSTKVEAFRNCKALYHYNQSTKKLFVGKQNSIDTVTTSNTDQERTTELLSTLQNLVVLPYLLKTVPIWYPMTTLQLQVAFSYKSHTYESFRKVSKFVVLEQIRTITNRCAICAKLNIPT